MQEKQDGKRKAFLLEGLLAGALSLLGVLTRLPNLMLIPPFEDEVKQTIYALSIRPGEFMPLVGNDAYAGPWFSYLLAVSMRLFGPAPALPRIVIMIMGALTVGATYGLARVSGLSRPWAMLVGLLMVANPHHILINSHYAGATYTVPLFTTIFLIALSLAVQRQSGAWLVVASIGLGLAIQATPVAALVLPGLVLWFLAQRPGGLSLRARWFYLATAAFVLTCAPLIVYNAQTALGSIQVARSRIYALQPAASFAVYIQHLWRLVLQLCRQVSGVLEGDESFRSLVGLPLLFSAWCGAGLVYAARQKSSPVAATVASQVLIMPWLSNSYGMIAITRYTSQLTPLLLVAMGMLAEGTWAGARRRIQQPILMCAMTWAVGALLVALSLWPLNSLWRFYDHAVERGKTNAHQLALGDELARQWQGDKILLSESVNRFIFMNDAWGEYNATEYLLATRQIPYTVLPFERMLERLAAGQETGRVILILHQDDLPLAQSQADLIAWESPAMQAARERGYGVYTLADAQQVRKPTFVLTDGTPLTTSVRAVQANFADLLRMIGYDPKSKLAPGERFIVNVYWKTIGAIPESYTGFLHLTGPDGRLVAQDDHELGRGIYRTFVWQADEVVRERYEWVMPKDLPNGDYTLRVGVYQFPSLKRLSVRSTNTSAQDDLVWLDTIHVGP
jgi:hypothetical protein